MKLFWIITFLIASVSCKSADNKMPDNEKLIGQDIVGVWELLKKNYRATDEPALVSPGNKEYLEIKADGTCQDDREAGKWFLSYTDNFIIDSTAKVIFTELTHLNPDSWGEYQRTIKSYQIKIVVKRNVECLYLTSLASSETRMYIRKT